MISAPFVYFGGKSTVAEEIWSRFGEVDAYAEPFCGSAAVLFANPKPCRSETINDLDGMICNVYRSIKLSPEKTRDWCEWPVCETDLFARQKWLIDRKQSLQTQLEADPDWHDPKIAGWWLWGMASSMIPQYASSDEPKRGIPRLGTRVGTNRNIDLFVLFKEIAQRLEKVFICCGNWDRILGKTSTVMIGTTAVFLDPPYGEAANRSPDVYTNDDLQVSKKVRDWAVANGQDPMMRIALAGYDGEHEMPSDWDCHDWRAQGGYSNQNPEGNKNRSRERIWFSPNCLKAKQLGIDWDKKVDAPATGNIDLRTFNPDGSIRF